MCGIAGQFVKGSGLDRAALACTVSALAHRGPDDSGVFEDVAHGVSLVHTRLSILDLSSFGHQPMASANEEVVVAFNGEIYNFRELRSELEAAGHLFQGGSDTEVLLQLYLAHGEAMLPRLNGIFAFAVWDRRARAMLMARDAMGVKPLYFSATTAGFSFSSEIKALQYLMPEPGALDHAALHRYMTFLWCPGEGTPLASVKKLGPGEALWVRDGEIQRRFNWYQLPACRPAPAFLSKSDSISGTVSALRRAVHRQMVSDVPVGAFLSGGLDSSSVVAFAREVNPAIRCYTIEAAGGQEEGMADDLPYARRVASHLNVPLEVVQIDSLRMAQDLETMVVQLDEPLADPAPLNVLYISRLAREHGIKVLLSGAGGDDLFGGYRRHLAVQAERLWAGLPQPARGRLERASSGLDQRRAVGRRLRKLFSGASLSGDARLVNYFFWTQRRDLLPLYSPAFRESLADQAAERPMLEFLASVTSSDRLTRMLALEQRFFLPDHNLTYTDKMSMAVGLEVRVPFLDLELVEFAHKVPSHFKQRRSVGKWVLKKAMEPYLPRDVIYRPKSGFGAPLRRWMRFELRELMGDLLAESSLKRRGLFDPTAVRQLIVANDSGKVDASYTLLSLLCVEMWCRAFIDGDSSRGTSSQADADTKSATMSGVYQACNK